jgi:pimeloyl-ACP methyl ester carboxylesterase
MRTVAPIVILLVSWCAASLGEGRAPDHCFAQSSPYENPPAAEPPYYRVRYEASTEPGELIFPVAYTVWIPPTAEILRGVIVHQHGCGEGSCKSGQTGAFDLHWQALARKHDCALLSPSYEQPDQADCQMWCDPRNGSGLAFQKSLEDLGRQSGRPELATVPWALWGHSGGGHWAGGMVMLHPQRVAAAWLRSGVPLFEEREGRAIGAHVLPEAALEVPIMCNLGTKEGITVHDGPFSGVWASNQTFFNAMRGRGALIAVSVDPRSSHDCGNQRYLAIPWFDACLAARLPANIDQPLKPIDPQQAWLAPLQSGTSEWIEPVMAENFAGDLATSIWLPGEAVAKAWTQYVADTAVADTTPPPVPTDLRLNGNRLTWEAVADLESGVSHFIIQRNGQRVATVPETPSNPFGRPLFQGLQYSDTPAVPIAEMLYVVDSGDPGDVGEYHVVAVNTVGLASP